MTGRVAHRAVSSPGMAYVSQGQLTQDCPCGRLRSVVVGTVAACPHCYRVSPVVSPLHIDDAMELLRRRPDPATRNWRPDLGETVDDLERENAAHGLV